MRILVTAGGTKEYIDGVRYIGNCSSGKTGALLADYLVESGHEVTWLGAECAVKPETSCEKIEYETFDDLSEALENALKTQGFDLVFQAAAVSDFKVAKVILDGQDFAAGRGVKLPTADEVQLALSKQPKLVSQIKAWSKQPGIRVAAFKLTNSEDPQVRLAAVAKLINQDGIDWVAHNDLNDFNATQHGFALYADLDDVSHCDDVQAMARTVLEQMEVLA